MKPEDLERLTTLIMPFGKYQGWRLCDLPGNYLKWFARSGFPKGEIGRHHQLDEQFALLARLGDSPVEVRHAAVQSRRLPASIR